MPAPRGTPRARPARRAALGPPRSLAEHGVGRPPRRARELLGCAGLQVGLDAGPREDLACELEPRARVAAGHVQDAALVAGREGQQRLGQMPGEGGAAQLVIHHPQLVALAPEREHRLDEVLASSTEQPGGADDQVVRVGLRGRALARGLRGPVDRQRPRRVGLHVGLALGAVEHVVGRDVEHALGRLRDVAGALRVHCVRAPRERSRRRRRRYMPRS